jgi:hypothetical protein
MICTTHDNYIENYVETYPSWEVKLASGLTVFQDDNRGGCAPHSAWARLHQYCLDNNDHIVPMKIRFRNNIHHLPSDADGYYFSKGARGSFFSPTMQLFFVGVLNDGKLEVTCWKVPEMLREQTEERDPEQAGICLIRKNMNQS